MMDFGVFSALMFAASTLLLAALAWPRSMR